MSNPWITFNINGISEFTVTRSFKLYYIHLMLENYFWENLKFVAHLFGFLGHFWIFGKSFGVFRTLPDIFTQIQKHFFSLFFHALSKNKIKKGGQWYKFVCPKFLHFWLRDFSKAHMLGHEQFVFVLFLYI